MERASRLRFPCELREEWKTSKSKVPPGKSAARELVSC